MSTLLQSTDAFTQCRYKRTTFAEAINLKRFIANITVSKKNTDTLQYAE